MKKNTPAILFYKTFVKNAQWRAKKLRERGSNTARPTEKGIGGLPIGARPVDFGASIRSRRNPRRHPRRHPADTLPTPCRHPADTRGRCRRQDTKKPDSSIGESGCSYRKASRALNLRLIPLASMRAGARSVRSGLARRSCIVMITSDRRHIGRCT